MGKIASATFYDASGTGYAFIAYPLDSSFGNDGAVYVFSQRTTDATGKGTHKLIYIGETGELGDSIINHEKWPCIRQYGANCICVHPDADAQGRLRKKADLIQNYNPPCNERK